MGFISAFKGLSRNRSLFQT